MKTTEPLPKITSKLTKELEENEDRELNQPDPKPGLEEFEEENVHLQPIEKEEKKESKKEEKADQLEPLG